MKKNKWLVMIMICVMMLMPAHANAAVTTISNKAVVITETTSLYNFEHKKIGSISKGSTWTRVNYTSDGWSALRKDKGLVYIPSRYCVESTSASGKNPVIAITRVTLNKSSVQLTEGNAVTLLATVSPANTTQSKAISWSSSNSSVASVANGRITAKNAGAATITARTTNGKTASCKITVKSKSVSNNMSVSGSSTIVKSVNNGNIKKLAAEIMTMIKTRQGTVTLTNYQLPYQDWNRLCNYINDTYFYKNYTSFVYSYSTYGGIRISINCSESRKYYAKAEEMRKMVQAAVKSANAKSGTQKTRVTRINNWICKKMTYTLAYGDAYNGFKKGKGRCSSYAAMFLLMCKEAGIECKTVTGRANGTYGWGPHAWNQVKISEKWYYVDVCWNDGTNSSKYLMSSKLWSSHRR